MEGGRLTVATATQLVVARDHNIWYITEKLLIVRGWQNFLWPDATTIKNVYRYDQIQIHDQIVN